MSGGTVWEQFTLDPRQQANAHLRAADRDRDVVTDLLATAYADGRLTREELDERADRVATAKTLGELPPVILDLVVPVGMRLPTPVTDLRAEAERRYRQRRQQALLGWLTPTLICWVVWSAVMFGGFPWPVFVTIGTGLRYAQLLITREDTVTGIERGLARREARRLEKRERKGLGQADQGDPPADASA